MFENSNFYTYTNSNISLGTRENSDASLLLSASRLFRQACFKGNLRMVWNKLRRNQARLINLCTLSLEVEGRCYAGLKEVKIADIRGTEGRVEDFDDGFNPLSQRTRDRWLNIAIARMSCSALPAVELIQIGDCYFVRDGHHRISVARALGGQVVDAEVTVWQVNGPLPWEKQPKAEGAAAAPLRNRPWKAGEGHGAYSISR
jgi:hypothetical protein